MATTAIARGPAGERARKNVRVRRRLLGLGLGDLADRMARLGRPVAVTGLSKIEGGGRRIDVDDLVALAVALDTSVAWLVLAPAQPDGKLYPLTPAGEFEGRALWGWMSEQRSLPMQFARGGDDK